MSWENHHCDITLAPPVGAHEEIKLFREVFTFSGHMKRYGLLYVRVGWADDESVHSVK